MQRQKRFALIALLLATSLLVVTACSDNGGSNGNGGGAEGSVELTMWMRTPETLDQVKQVAERFREASGININIIDNSGAGGTYSSALQAAVVGEELPDIFQMSDYTVSQLHDLGLIQPIPFDEAFMEQFDDGTWMEGLTTIDGEVYAWPDRSYRRGVFMLFYNKQVMRDAGLDPEKPPVTWDDLKEQARIVTEHGNGKVFGLSFAGQVNWAVEQSFGMMSSTVNREAGVYSSLLGNLVNWRTGRIFTGDSLAETVAFIKELIDMGVTHPNLMQLGNDESAAMLAQNQTAFNIDGHWRITDLLSDYPDLDFGVTMLPRKEADLPPLLSVSGGNNTAFAVSAKTKNVDAIKEWFEYLSEHYYPMLIEDSIDLSPLPSVNEQMLGGANEHFADYIQVIQETALLQPSPALRNSAEIGAMDKFLANPASEPHPETIQGYLSGQNIDIAGFLARHAENRQQALESGIGDTEGASMDDWIFPNWDKTKDYTPDMYEALK